MKHGAIARSIERLAVAVIVQAFADLTAPPLSPAELATTAKGKEMRKQREDDRLEDQRLAWTFLIGQGQDNQFGIEWWCEHIGLDPQYVALMATRLKHDPTLAAEVRFRISYLGTTGNKGSFLPPAPQLDSVEGEEREETDDLRSEEERDEQWHSTILSYISKRGTNPPMP